MFKFKPIFKQSHRGNDRIMAFKHLDLKIGHVGESWELSGFRNSESVVSRGPHDGKPLGQLVHELRGRLVGQENYRRFGNEFPLLVKLIDTRQSLSLQVHATSGDCFIAEIRDTSDVTYYLGHDKYADTNNDQMPYTPLQDQGVQLVSSPSFNIAVYDLDDPMTIDYSDLDSFVALIALAGSGELCDDSGQRFTFRQGETVLLPATLNTLRFEGTLKFLEIYV